MVEFNAAQYEQKFVDTLNALEQLREKYGLEDYDKIKVIYGPF